jgi:hypothetical protein
MKTKTLVPPMFSIIVPVAPLTVERFCSRKRRRAPEGYTTVHVVPFRLHDHTPWSVVPDHSKVKAVGGSARVSIGAKHKAMPESEPTTREVSLCFILVFLVLVIWRAQSLSWRLGFIIFVPRVFPFHFFSGLKSCNLTKGSEVGWVYGLTLYPRLPNRH